MGNVFNSLCQSPKVLLKTLMPLAAGLGFDGGKRRLNEGGGERMMSRRRGKGCSLINSEEGVVALIEPR